LISINGQAAVPCEAQVTVAEKGMAAKFLRELAARCRMASRNCFDLKAQQELREIGDQLAIKADELEKVTRFAAVESSEGGQAK
jgi:hypothetical protein